MELTVVDAFTDEPFRGNPAAVAVLDVEPTPERMQAIASEMNLSETAFTCRRADGDYSLRWFTPTSEVDLCGHATLATAHVLGTSVRFHTRSGLLSCRRSADGRIEMDLPRRSLDAAPLPSFLAEAGGRSFSDTGTFALVEFADTGALRSWNPDFAAISGLRNDALIITGTSDRAGIDCVSRVFAPKLGIAEDPVTGSAACVLAPFWAERLGRVDLVGEQASRRGGIVTMRLLDEGVAVGGKAVTVAQTTILF